MEKRGKRFFSLEKLYLGLFWLKELFPGFLYNGVIFFRGI
jgi:hypothetical protein